jgi:benzoyl-CoA reductase/2-hydroxyglutaryl-CoA dehydratase subunit BcrC/BadD/HgdB
LLDAYQDPLGAARAASARGAAVIALVGVGIPEEIILACGAASTTLFPRIEQPTPIANDYMDPNEQPELRSLLDQLASSEARLYALAVLTSPYATLSASIEDLRRAGLLPDAAPIEYFEVPMLRAASDLRYAARRVRALTERIGSVTGRAATVAALRDAIALINRRRAALSTFDKRRRGLNAITGRDAFRVIGAGAFLDPASYVEVLEALTDSLQADRSLRDRPRILLIPSSPLTHDAAHAAIEAAGGLVVAEDDPLGTRAATSATREDDDPIQAIAEHYLESAIGSGSYPSERRLAWFRAEAVKPDIDAVVFYAQEARYGWDHPVMRAFLDENGIPSVFIRADARDANGRARMEQEVAAFLAALPLKAPEVAA